MKSFGHGDLSAISTPQLANEMFEFIRLVGNANEQVVKWFCIMLLLAAIDSATVFFIGRGNAGLPPIAIILVVVIAYPTWRWQMALLTSSRFTNELRERERELVKRRGRHGY